MKELLRSLKNVIFQLMISVMGPDLNKFGKLCPFLWTLFFRYIS